MVHTEPHIKRVPGLLPGVKLRICEANHSVPLSTEVKYNWSNISTHHSVFLALCMTNCTFTFTEKVQAPFSVKAGLRWLNYSLRDANRQTFTFLKRVGDCDDEY